MKRYSNLYAKVVSIDNLMLADSNARRGKQNTHGVRAHDKHREDNIMALHRALKDKTFRTSAYDIFKIYEPKEREIYRLPYYPDRIVHHAAMNILEPIWMKVFTHNTYSCVKGRGIEGCARHIDSILRRHRHTPRLYCLKIDIKKYYPSIDNTILKAIVRKKIKDQELLWLLDEIIDSAKGLPIGNYLSQYLANLYLAYFMHYVNERLHADVGKPSPFDAAEYADDIVIFAESKVYLHRAFRLIYRYLSDELNLEIKGNYQVFPIAVNRFDRHGRALDYVGYKFYRRQKLIRTSIKRNYCRTAGRLNKRKLTPLQYKIGIAPWLGWAKHSNSRHLLKKTINRIDIYDSIL